MMLKKIWLDLEGRFQWLYHLRERHFRAMVFSAPGVILSLVYAIANGVVGIVTDSVWYGTLCAYYLLLYMMRIFVLLHIRKWENDRELRNVPKELSIYHRLGVMFLWMGIILGGMVSILLLGEGGKTYPGIFIYVVALYTFSKLGWSIRNLIVWKKKEWSVLLKALRYIGYLDALVSLLSLQTAMIFAFSRGKWGMVSVMDAIVGGLVSISAFIIGSRMISEAKREKARFHE